MNKTKLAYQAIEHYLQTGAILTIKPKGPTGACFVTLYLDKRLRGCIGSPEAFEPLDKNIVRNAVEAATADWRFPPVTLAELPLLKIEVSVLTPLKPYQPKSARALLTYLQKNKPGLVISLSGHLALFLPQVLQELPDAATFLSELCLKAGLPADSWQDKSMCFFIFKLL